MIKLTINPNKAPLVKIFDQKVITIGSGSGPIRADLSLSDQSLQPIHVKILDEGTRCLVINLANDPFVTLNELPFGKKVIKDKDILSIGSQTILFELENRFETSLEFKRQQNSLNLTLERMIDAQQSPKISEIENQLEAILSKEKQEKNENLSAEMDIDDLMHEVEQFECLKENEESPPEEFHPYFPSIDTDEEYESTEQKMTSDASRDQKTIPFVSHKKHAPEFQVGEFDDESENWILEKDGFSDSQEEKSLLSINWKIVGTFTISILLILLLTVGALYFNVSAKNADEELKAAESIADIAMALKYAQIHHIKPNKKNWSDPEFIKSSLAQVIPHDYPSLVKIDPQGHLNDTSYSLRIYTSTDFSQFLVIAQPAPSILQWLIPKTAIVIDSKLMQLNKVYEMKTLNRLLVNSNNLDNSNAIEVTDLVKRGELISLYTLAQKRRGQDFSPPKALALLRPGAENYIYNAPRYYQLGETIMKRAIDLMEMPGSVYEMSRLKQDMSLLSKMHDMVLYSSNGIQLTLEAQKAIAAFVSNARFLTAYLKFDPEGIIISSHLIIDDESSHHHYDKRPEIKKNELEISLAEEKPQMQAPPPEEHPLLSHLIALCVTREKSLIPLKNQLTVLLKEDASYPIHGFDIHLAYLLQEYADEDLKQKKLLAKEIHHLAEEYRLIPLDEFMSYLKKAGLGEGCREILKHIVEEENNEEHLHSFMASIESAENFTELEKIISDAHRWLIIKNFSDLQDLLAAGRLIKIATISRINKLLFSSMPTPIGLVYDAEQKITLQHILQFSLDTLEEQTYYLSEFERMMKNEV